MDAPQSKAFEMPSLQNIHDWLKTSGKLIALGTIVSPFIGGLFVLRFGITIGFLPRARWESVLTDLFGISVFGITLGLMMVTMFMACPLLWRWAHHGEGPESVHPRAAFFTFLFAQLSVATMIIALVLWEHFSKKSVSAEIQGAIIFGWAIGFFLVLPILTAPRDRLKNWWPTLRRGAALGRMFIEFMCAITASMVTGMVVSGLMEFDDGWQVVLGMIVFSVIYSAYANALATPKDSRHAEIWNWVGGGLLSLAVVFVWFGDKVSAASLHNLGYANLTGVVLTVDEEGKRMLVGQNFVSEQGVTLLPPSFKSKEPLYLVKGVDVVNALGDPYVVKKHDGSRRVRNCRFSAVSAESHTQNTKEVRCLVLAAAHVRSIGTDENAAKPQP